MLIVECDPAHDVYFRPLHMSACTAYTPECLLRRMRGHIKPNGDVDTLSIDFQNKFIPIANREQLDLACRLATAYHNSIVNENLQVRELRKEKDTSTTI